MKIKRLLVVLLVMVIGTAALLACDNNVTAPEDIAAAAAVTKLVDELPAYGSIANPSLQLYDARDSINAAKEGYDALSEKQKALILPATETKLAGAVEWIGTIDWDAVDLWKTTAEGVNAQITALPTLTAVTTANQSVIYVAKKGFDALSDSQKALVTAANREKLTALINKINSIYSARLIYDTYIFDEESEEYVKASSHASVLEAIETVLSSENEPDVSVPFSGDYVVESTTGQVVFRKTKGGSAALGNSNMHYAYRGNTFIGAVPYYAGIYDDYNALTDDTVLVHSQNGVSAYGTGFRSNYTIAGNDNTRFLDYNKGVYAGTMLTNDAFDGIKQKWALSEAEIMPGLNNGEDSGKLFFYYGANYWNLDTQIGLYLDLATGEWKFYHATMTGNGGSWSGTNNLTYNFENDEVVLTSTKDIFGAWRPDGDLNITLTYDYNLTDKDVVMKLSIINVATSQLHEYSYTIVGGAAPKNIDGSAGFFLHWGISFITGQTRRTSGAMFNDVWSGGYINNLVLNESLGRIGDDFAYGVMHGQNAWTKVTANQIDFNETRQPNPVEGQPDLIKQQIFNFDVAQNAEEYTLETAIEKNESPTVDIETDGVRLYLIDPSQKSIEIDLNDYIDFKDTATSVMFYIGSSDTVTASVSAITDNKFTVTGLAEGDSTVTVNVVQHGKFMFAITFRVVVDNSYEALNEALGSLDLNSLSLDDIDYVLVLIDAYNSLSTAERALVTNYNKLESAIIVMQVLNADTFALYDAYLYDEDSQTYVKASSHSSVLEAVAAVFKSAHKVESTSIVENDGEYVKERLTGNIVFRETNGGNAAIGNGNTHYLYRNNKHIENLGWTSELYPQINALEDDTVLVNSASGVAAFGKGGISIVKDKGDNFSARFVYNELNTYAATTLTLLDRFDTMTQKWTLSGAEIMPASDGMLMINFGANVWNAKTIIGIYLDHNTGEWKFFSSSATVSADMSTTYNFSNTTVILTSTKNIYGAWVPNGDLNLTYTHRYNAETQTVTLTLVALNPVTEESFTHSITVAGASYALGSFYMYWDIGLTATLPRSSGAANRFPAIWSATYAKNVILTESLVYNDTAGVFGAKFGQNSFNAMHTTNVSIASDGSNEIYNLNVKH